MECRKDDTNSNPSCSSRMLEYSSRIEEHLLGSFRLHCSESISIPLIQIPHTTSFALSNSHLSERDHDIIVSCCQGFLQKPFYHGDRHPHFVSIDPGWVLKVSLLFVRTVQAYRAMEALAVSSSIASSASFSTCTLFSYPILVLFWFYIVHTLFLSPSMYTYSCVYLRVLSLSLAHVYVVYVVYTSHCRWSSR